MSSFTTSQHLGICKYCFWSMTPIGLGYGSYMEGMLQGAFTKLGKATVGFVIFVRPHGATRLPLVRFPPNFILVVLKKSVEKIQVWLTADTSNGRFVWRPTYSLFMSTVLNRPLVALCLSDTCKFSLFVSLNMGNVRWYTLLLRSLWIDFHVHNLILLAVFGSLYLTDTRRRSVFLVWC